MIYWNLFLGFLEVGLFSFGGGYGAVSLIRDVVLRYGWLTDDMLTNIIAISESTPGPIMVNLATYVGSTQGGLLGALIATITSVLPAFIIILVLMVGLRNVLEKPVARALLNGLKACVTGIILATGLYMVLKNCFPILPDSVWEVRSFIILGLLLFLYFVLPKIIRKKISPILLIALSAILGAILFAL